VAIPTNLDAATAIDLGPLPAHVVQDVYDVGTATAYTVWYKYTPVASDLVLGAFASGDAVLYTPRLEVYQDAFGTAIPQALTATNRPVQFPVEVGVFDAYYFKLVALDPAATPAVLTLDVRRAPIDAARRGDLCVIDDARWFPAVILSPTTDYQVRRFVSGFGPDVLTHSPGYGFPAGEVGDILPDGTMLLADNAFDQTVYCFDKTFTAIATPALAAGGIRSNRAANNFYVASGGTVSVVSALGVITATHAITSGAALAANAAETLLYGNAAGDSSISRWSLLTDAPLAALAPPVAGIYTVDDLLVLDDDTILAAYFDNDVAPHAFFVRHYDPSGTVLRTYTLGHSSRLSGWGHIAYGLDSTTFWAWIHPPGADDACLRSVFQCLRVSDGVLVAEVTHAEYEDGGYFDPDPLTPLARFGCSISCPFFLLTQDEAPVTPLLGACPVPTPSSPSSLPSTGAAPVFP